MSARAALFKKKARKKIYINPKARSNPRLFACPEYVRGTIIPFPKTTLSSNASIYLRLPYGVKPVNESWGKFTENNSLVEGYLVCENGFDTQTKDMFTGSFLSALDKESLKANRLSFVQSGDVDAKKFGPKADGKHVSETKTDTKTLYAIAKAFIKAVQDAM